MKKSNVLNPHGDWVINSNLEKTMIGLDEYIDRRRSTILSQSLQQSPNMIAWPPHDEPPAWTPARAPAHHLRVPDPNPKGWGAAIKATKKAASFSKRTRRPVSWRALSEVSVAGVSAALDRRSPLLRRVLWACVLTVCTALMLAQCWDRVQRYLEEPVNVNVRITHNDSLEYPAITVCNKNIFNRTAALELMIQHKLVPADATDAQVNISLLVGTAGMTPSTVWPLLAHRLDVFVAECWFGRGVTCNEQGRWTMVQTVTGPCYTYMINNTHVSAVGTFHNLYLRLFESTPIARKDETGVRILVHERRESPVLTARTQSMSAELGWSREVKLELRKFHILNTDKTPCRDDEKYSEAECQLACFQNFMFDISKCRMPYMTGPRLGNQSECANPSIYEESMEAVNSMLLSGGWSANDCICPHQCHQTAFQMYPENMAFKKNEIKLRIFYDNLVFEQITEERAYPTISLLCDIGGTLGLLMGASVLTVCELLEVLWSRFLQGCCRLEERQPPPPQINKPPRAPKAHNPAPLLVRRI